MKSSSETGDREAMLAAIRLNWRLWTIIQSELLDPASTVPSEIRLNVLSLSRFVDATTVDFLADPVSTKLRSLIAINRELAGGLYAIPDAADATSAVGVAGDRGDNRIASQDPAPASLRLTI
ncbi:MAG: flagellar biosynthesis regulator FlaF [Rhodospirillales bacterium]